MVYERFPSHSRPHRELCNRSRSSSSVRTTLTCNLEDYWEDASACLMSSCESSWEAKTTRAIPDQDSARVNKLYPIRALSSSTTMPLYEFMVGSAKRHRSFPPPVAACTTLSIKGGGRFVLKEMVGTGRPRGFFHAERENGRLRLHLVLPEEVDSAHNDDDDVDDQDLESCISHEEGGQGYMENITMDDGEACREHGTRMEEGTLDDDDDDDSTTSSRSIVRVRGEGETDEHKGEGSACQSANEDTIWDKLLGYEGCGNRGREVWQTCKREPNEMYGNGGVDVEGISTSYGDYAVGEQHHEQLWNLDTSCTQDGSLCVWRPSQLLVPQPLLRMRPSLGLAMS